MTLIRICLSVGVLAFLLAPAGISVAQGTPDGVTPAVEAVCSKVRGGAEYGLCVAYCEANDCDLEPGSQECSMLRKKYAVITGVSRRRSPAIFFVAFLCAAISAEPRYVRTCESNAAFEYLEAFQTPLVMYAAVR